VLFAAEHVQYVVLDEADKMLSLGLQPQLKRIRALVIPRKSKATTEVGAGVLVKPHTRRKRPQVSTIIMFRLVLLPVVSYHCSVWTFCLCLFPLEACEVQS
jgi:ABC-type Na+ efflux pump permease subunit